MKLGRAPLAQVLMFFSSIKFNFLKFVEEMHMGLGILLSVCALDDGFYDALNHHAGSLIYGCDDRFSISIHVDHNFRAGGNGNFSSPFEERFQPFRSSLQIFVKKLHYGD
jgi:hypothetical protein